MQNYDNRNLKIKSLKNVSFLSPKLLNFSRRRRKKKLNSISKEKTTWLRNDQCFWNASDIQL